MGYNFAFDNSSTNALYSSTETGLALNSPFDAPVNTHIPNSSKMWFSNKSTRCNIINKYIVCEFPHLLRQVILTYQICQGALSLQLYP